MKKVIVRNLYAVGMHNWGGKELSIRPLYYCRLEEDNPKDQNAVAIFGDKERRQRVADFRREDAVVLAHFFRQNLVYDHCYVRAKFSPSKFSKKKGPMQNCSVAFMCPDDRITEVKNHLTSYEHKIW